MTTQEAHSANGTYDVAICGGGLAGLTLALQLRQQLPDASVVLVDRLARPLPEAAFKVGESTVEAGAFYFGRVLGLASYFEQCHLRKMGLRYFFLGSKGLRLQDRPEYGLTDFPSIDTYQIDRGMLENDLRAFGESAGVKLLEGCPVQDIVLANGDGLHSVLYRRGSTGPMESVKARWVVDAMGRRRLLQKKLGLGKPNGRRCSASWFRYDGRIDVNDLVPETEVAWHNRVPNKNRYYSTTHLMGDGYWVWLIPLGSGTTSVGIVALEDLHPFDGFNTYARSMEWLRQHEPELAVYLEGREPLDFRVMRQYSYSSRQVFSTDRWACTGEAGVFSDPFYSPGSDIIGFGNSMITQMIGLDRQGQLTADLVEEYNRFLLALNNLFTYNFQIGYHFHGHPLVMTAKLLWDVTAAWSFNAPYMFHSIYLDRTKRDEIRKVTANFFFLTQRMQQFFVEWAARSSGRASFEFLNYLSIPYLKEHRQRNLKTGKTLSELIADQTMNMETLEELAQVFFLLAVEDVLPEHLHRFPGTTWLNAWSVGLNPEKWEAEGLFRPTSAPRDLTNMRDQIRSLFHFQAPAPRSVELADQVMQ